MSDWDLLDERERAVLTAMGKTREMIHDPIGLARQLGWSWQRVVRVMKPLETFRMVRVRRHTKMTIYELTPSGEKALAQRDGTVGTG